MTVQVGLPRPALCFLLAGPRRPASASEAVEPTTFDVRADLRADRGFQFPIAEVRAPNGSVLERLDCLDDGVRPDTAAGDRLFSCRGAATASGAGVLVVLAGSNGSAPSLEVDQLAFTFLPGRTVRWTWRPSSRAPSGPQSESQAIAGRLASELGSEGGASAPLGPPPKDPSEMWFGGSVVRPVAVPRTELPMSTNLPPWWVWLAAVGGGAALLLARTLHSAALRALARTPD